MYRIRLLFCLMVLYPAVLFSQSPREQYDLFRKKINIEYLTFRRECNLKYLDFLRNSWNLYQGKAPLALPEDDKVPPRPYVKNEEDEPVAPVEVVPVVEEPLEEPVPQPKPVEPVPEVNVPDRKSFSVDFYGITCNVRMPECAMLTLKNCKPNSIADGWQQLNVDEMNNAIRDCLETRIRYGFCDWAYLCFLDELCRKFCPDSNGATLLMAYLYSQSGYQMRLAADGDLLRMLFGSRYQIYNSGYFDIDGVSYYPWGGSSDAISICNFAFEGEKPMSIGIDSAQRLGEGMTTERTIASEQYGDMSAVSQVPQQLIEFYSRYPSAAIGGNPLTRWAICANTPLAGNTSERLYPVFREAIKGLSQRDAADKLLNWVQTGLEYEYDDKVWGHDRAFFAEESLYYPYCDCEDRSILFSRLVRDLLGLDVALVYYPGHLATAVCFTEDVAGDSMMIEGRKFTVCDPTYIGAPVGSQMPDLDYGKVRVLVL